MWQPIETAPKDRPIIACDANSSDATDVYITEWTNDVYTYQGGHGGRAGWFRGRYSDHWGDSPIMDNPVKWQEVPVP